ncbi:MAG: BolA/IbaG family iron-sulfur metabolism protein [Chlamydiales bacterium]|nr:BolA/IbaG family iron-sulfur metabolism protein [Chlamydiales bacterium]NCF71363.1 BolA/IbaG family iron-sulfur metabolism protein [Chlamydiales bacterium]
MREKIKEAIVKELPDAEVHILSDDEVHFQGIVISAQFEGLSLVKQHQLVMNSLKKYFEEELHALGLQTFTPEKWEMRKNNARSK